jgi:hypothetical protein
MLIDYREDMTLRDARRDYFAANHFGDDGGYGEAWVDFKLGVIPFPIPNAPSRVRAVKFHDLHHVLTGYDTNTVGEFEISAWEIAAGCKGFAAAWALNLSGMAAGAIVAPQRIWRAFMRGRRSRSLYGESMGELLGTTVGEARARYLPRDREEGVTASDVAAFVAALGAGLTAMGVFTLVTVPLVPVGLLAVAMRRRARPTHDLA